MNLRQGARVIVETCMAIKPKEKVLIITSTGFTKNSKTLAQEAEALGAEVSIMRVSVNVI